MTDPEKLFVYPNDVDNFGFDWGRLALTVGPEVNDAKAFSAGVVFVPPDRATPAITTQVPRKLSLLSKAKATKWSKMKWAIR